MIYDILGVSWKLVNFAHDYKCKRFLLVSLINPWSFLHLIYLFSNMAIFNSDSNIRGYFWMPPVTKTLLIANFAIYFLQRIFPPLESLFGLHYFESQLFSPFQTLTYMFLHGDFNHIFFNMFALFMFGRVIEQMLGKWRFLLYYAVCGVTAAAAQEIVWWLRMGSSIESLLYLNNLDFFTPAQMSTIYDMFITIGASGAIFGLLLAFAVMLPNQPIFLFFLPIPIKAKWFVGIYALLELMEGIKVTNGDNVAHFAHLGGMIGGALLLWYWRREARRNLEF